MAASQEWTDWHLTPNGWVAGEKKRDSGLMVSQIPTDRVKSVRYMELCNGYSTPFGDSQEQWQSKDDALVQALLDQFGPAPKCL